MKQEIQVTSSLSLLNMIILRITITEWNKLDCYIRNADSNEGFKKRLLSFIKPMSNSM